MAIYDPMLDIGYAAAQAFAADEKNRVPIVLAETFEPFNRLLERRETRTGKVITGYTVLKDSGNASMATLFDKRTSNVNNLVTEFNVNWCLTQTNWSYNRIMIAMNSQAADSQVAAKRIFDYLLPLRKVAIKDMAKVMQDAIFKTPASASDNLNPVGLAGGWLALGTDGSEGGFTGYTGRYYNSTTTFNVGGIPCSSSVNPLWASYYADHGGQLGDFLLYLIDAAQESVRLMAPRIPEKGIDDGGWGNMIIFTTLNVIKNLKSYVRKDGDDVRNFAEVINGVLYINNVPVIRASVLETATSSWGTDPVVGVNLDKLVMAVLEDDNFYEGRPRQRDEMPDWYTIDVSCTWGLIAQDRRNLGFLISQHPGS